jgi:hypothetical protein
VQYKLFCRAAVFVALGTGCEVSSLEPIRATFVAVDSGGGAVVPGIRTQFDTVWRTRRRSRMGWSNDGASLMIAGPDMTLREHPSALWSVNVASLSVTRLLSTTDRFGAVDCYRGTTDCDVLRPAGGLLRRFGDGDTTTLLASSYTEPVISANGRFIVYDTSTAGIETRLLDATTQLNRLMGMSKLSPEPATVASALSDDGVELDLAGFEFHVVGPRVIRRNMNTGTTFWPIPLQPGWADVFVLDIRWVESTLYVLAQSATPSETRWIQYVVGTSASTLLGTTKRGVAIERIAWRPAIATMLVQKLSACDVQSGYPGCANRQDELEMLRGGTSTRVARSPVGFPQLTLSPDGRYAAYGSAEISIKQLPP